MVLIKFNGELYKEVKTDRGTSECTGCHWDGDMSVKCPSETDDWQCNGDNRDDDKDNLVLQKYTLTNLLTDL